MMYKERVCVSDIFPLWWVRTFVSGFQCSGLELIMSKQQFNWGSACMEAF